MKRMYQVFTSLLMFFLLVPSAFCAAPAISVDLALDKTAFAQGEAVGVTVTVTNAGPDIPISAGISQLDYYLEMRVIDPAGNLLITQRPVVVPETPDAPPLPFVLNSAGVPVQAAPCETLAAGWQKVSRSDDIRPYYNMTLPGTYSAQVQISAKVFKGPIGTPCDVRDFEWVGVLKSDTKYFTMQGVTPVTMSAEWPSEWSTGSTALISINVSPPPGKTVNDIDQATIKLNNVPATSVTVLNGVLVASFDRQAAIQSIGTVQPGEMASVMITGKLKSGVFFGGAQKVKILSAYNFEGFFSPIDKTTVNTAKAGQTVAVKWRITGGAGLPAPDSAGSFKGLYTVDCNISPGFFENTIPEETAGASGLQYLGNYNWQYNWKVPKAYADKCKTMVIILGNDSYKYTADFHFKK